MIVLLGGSGYVGSVFAEQLAETRLDHCVLSRTGVESVDYTDADVLTNALQCRRATFLINAAGFTGKPNVDACENQKTECLFANSVLPGRIAEACRRVGISWGHISSGCIYTGHRLDGEGFRESDTPNFTFRQNNCSFYSGSKALGEEVLIGENNVYIWRLRIPFDHQDGPRNYLSKVMRYERLLEATNSISQLQEAVGACLESHERSLPFGTYNITNPGSITTSEVTRLIQASGVCDKEFQFFSGEDEFMELAAKTPRSNCVLSSEKLASHGIHLSPVREAIQKTLANWIPEACAPSAEV